jgi:hypothetical protein
MSGERRAAGCKTGTPERCPVCASRLVEPVYWAHQEPGVWTVDLRCPECESGFTVTLDDQAAHAYNVFLYDAADELACRARRLEEEWSSAVAGEDERFVRALRADRILPIDF